MASPLLPPVHPRRAPHVRPIFKPLPLDPAFQFPGNNKKEPRSGSQLHGLLSRSTYPRYQAPYGTSGTSVMPIANAIAVHSMMPRLRTIAM